MKHSFCVLTTLGLFLGMAGQAMAQPTYSFTTLDVPGSSYNIGTYANGINASGQIVGGGGTYGFLLDNGSYTTLDVPGSIHVVNGAGDLIWSPAQAINDSGQIVGYYYGGAPVYTTHGFLLDHGSYTTLDVPGSTGTEAHGINSSGQIVGKYYDSAGHAHGFLLDQGNYTTLDVPGSDSTEVHGINSSGQIVGYYADAPPQNKVHAFLLNQGTYTTLDPPGSQGAFAYGIKDSEDRKRGHSSFLPSPCSFQTNIPDLINDDEKLLESSFVVPSECLADVAATVRASAPT
jgi:uncharacterized membrane protein